MRPGLWIALGTCVLTGILAAPAQAYIYWTVQGDAGSTNGTAIGRADQDGSAITHGLVDGASGPTGIAVDSAHIYWANTQTNSIGRANLDGTGPSPMFIPNATNASGSEPIDVAVDGSSVYWTDSSEYVGKANLDGTGPNPHWLDDGAGSRPTAIAVSQGNVYFSDLGTRIREVPAGSTTPSTLATLNTNADPFAMAIAGGYIYYSAINPGNPMPAGTIGRVPISGGAPTTIVSGLAAPSGVATDGQELYWVDRSGMQNKIGRAQLSGGGITNPQYGWISEAGGPWGVAVDANIDSTQTRVSCSSSSVTPGSATSCTATVGDAASSAPPTGIVAFSSNPMTAFSGSGSSCTLAPTGGGTYACTVEVSSTATGTVPVTASYQGDALHQTSSASTSFCSGSPSQCAGGPGSRPSGPGNTHVCIVPKLKGKTLPQARKLLAKAHCKLGKVKKAKARKGHRPFVITSQQPAAGTRRSAGAKVRIHLKPRPRKRTK